MPISWNEIRANATRFAKEWCDETREHAEANTFWDEFFRIFGLTRRHLASFQEPVRGLSGSFGFIDLFWKGTLLAEHKSAGKDLSKAQAQAMDYIQSLQRENRGNEVPRYLVLSDFRRMALHDLDEGTSIEFDLKELPKNIDSFGFIPGYRRHVFTPQDPINLQAVEIMGRLHDALEEGGYRGHELERMLVRILFCLFAEDTGIFERNAFQFFLEDHTRPDGSDLGVQLAQYFHVLNTPSDRRQTNLLEELAALPYVNGELFAENLSFAAFNSKMRDQLLACTKFDWSRISPAVFGALFQSVMEPAERRQIGAHYTTEPDILKVIGPLFLDELKEALEAAGNDSRKLRALHERIAKLRLLDPACGCGNFLVVAYRELRLLELEILKRLHKRRELQSVFDIEAMLRVDVDQMYGIEIDEWPSRIAEVALWLVDHQMNNVFSATFGEYFVRLPLKKSPHIVCANALRIDWNDVLPAEHCSYIFGNPPFVGSSYQTKEQKEDLFTVTGGIEGYKLLDYVCAWYFKTVAYCRLKTIRAAFVSTNSITQGEHIGVLWDWMQNNSQVIFFAHRTFKWNSEARGKAAVHCVIIGFCTNHSGKKIVFDYESEDTVPMVLTVSNINAYLVDAPNVILKSRSKPIQSTAPIMTRGSQPTDGGNLILSSDELSEIQQAEPLPEGWVRRFLMGDDFINGHHRYCLWLKGADPSEVKKRPKLMERIERVRTSRLASKKKVTNDWANRPSLFQEDRQPNSVYLAIPQVSSKRRDYIPIGFISKDVVAGNKLSIIINVSNFHFGVLSSSMHMSWTKVVCGRLKSDYNYSSTIVYNNFPWPESPTDAQKKAVEDKAQAVLDVRAEFPDATLADLYDPLTMPPKLLKAHTELDRAVERCYRSKPFANDRERVEFLFELYQKLTQPLIAKETKAKRRPKK